MKKSILTLILGAVFMTGAFSQANSKTAVVYFSATGNTERLAKTTASAMKADLFKIEPEQPYTSADLNWNDKNSRSTKECNDSKSRPAIKNKIDVSPYDTVIIGFPVWWYNAPKIIYTFVENADLSEKKVVLICTSGGSGLGSTTGDLSKLDPKADWRRGTRFSPRASEKEVKDFLEKALE